MPARLSFHRPRRAFQGVKNKDAALWMDKRQVLGKSSLQQQIFFSGFFRAGLQGAA
jgi:hypothetical protein